jgi:transcriptional regulator GlxA family with amidase domain
LEDFFRLRRARDLMDRDYAKPLDVPALARVALMSPGHFSRSFRVAFGETPYSYDAPDRAGQGTAAAG